MRILALDIGNKRTGIATSDASGRVATPVCVTSTSDLTNNTAAWRRILQDWEPDALLVGLPLSLDGGQSVQTKRTQAIAQAVAQAAGLDLHFTDERLSSVEAKRSLHELGAHEKDMRGKVDMIAASLFLQSWLDEQQQAMGQSAAQAASAGSNDCTQATNG